MSFCTVPTPSVVYAGPTMKEEFDRIPLEETIHDWAHDKVETLLRNDGQPYESRCHSKAFGDIGKLYVIFQWVEHRVSAVEVSAAGGAK